METSSTSSYSLLIGGKKVKFLTAGPDSGRVVLLLHGGQFTSEAWAKTKTLERLAKEGHRAVAVDLPGFRESASTTLQPVEWLSQQTETSKLGHPVSPTAPERGWIALPLSFASPIM